MTVGEPDVRAMLASREVRLLAADVKPVAKLEVAAADAPALHRRLERAGFVVATVGGQSPTNIAARVGDANDGAAVVASRTEALALEAARLIEAGPAEVDRARLERLGALLGYPPCCVDAFGRWSTETTDDIACLGFALDATRDAVEPALDPWAPWGGIEYVPCALDCARSLGRVARSVEAGAIAPVTDPHAKHAQLVISALSRLCLTQAELSGDRLRFAGVAAVGARDCAVDALVSLLSAGDALLLARGGISVLRGDSVIGHVANPGVVAYVPGTRDAWTPGAPRPDPSAYAPAIVLPSAPSAALRQRFAAVFAGLARPHEVFDGRGEGRVLLMDDGEHAFFRGSVEPREGGDYVTITSLHRAHMPGDSPRRRLHARLRSLAPFLLPRDSAQLSVVVFRRA